MYVKTHTYKDAAGPSQEVSSDSESKAPAAMVVQEEEEEICGGDSRCVC